MNNLREQLKSGPLSSLYRIARNLKRQLRHEDVAGTIPMDFPPLHRAELHALLAALPHDARLYYSLGLVCLQVEGNARAAVSVFRCADCLSFESPERLNLYMAVALARCGRSDMARQLLALVADEIFTAPEQATREELARSLEASSADSPGTAPGRSWEALRARVEDVDAVGSVLILGDHTGESCDWFPGKQYFLAASEVTGIGYEQLARLDKDFDLVISLDDSQDTGRFSSIRCKQRLSL